MTSVFLLWTIAHKYKKNECMKCKDNLVITNLLLTFICVRE